MDRARLEVILDQDMPYSERNQTGCSALLGLNLIAKYLPGSGIGGAEHDQIYACGVNELLVAGITEEDAIALRKLNWFIDEDSLATFV